MSPKFFVFLLSLFGVATLSQGQVLVYKLDFSKDKGINYSTFEGGYFVAPLLGGSGTFLLTSSDEGLRYVESAEGGRLFTAINNGDKKAVISATTGTGTASGAFVVLGDINHTVHVDGPSYNLDARVAKTLTGTAISADDESTAETAATDGSVGSAGISQLKASLDADETNRANRDGLSLAQAVEQVKLTLERQGFSSGETDDDDDDTDDGTDDGTDTPVTTTATTTTATTQE